MKKSIRSFILIILTFILLIFAVACFNPAGTTGSLTAVSATTAANAGQTSAGSTAAATTGLETTASSYSTKITGPAASTNPLPLIEYYPLPANKTSNYDLNRDGVKESLSYRCVDDYSFNITLNQNILRYEGEMFLPNWFFLLDLDSRDQYLDIAIQELGPSDDYQVTFFYYNGSQLILRGVVPGMICDPSSETIGTDPFGKGTIKLDGLGGLTARARGQILHTWFYDEPWLMGADGQLNKLNQDYYPMQSYDPDTGAVLPETSVKLKMDLPLLQSPGSSAQLAPARSGQTVSLVQTDNREWVQLRKPDGGLGWFRLVDNFQVMINGSRYFSDEVFAGLSFAD